MFILIFVLLLQKVIQGPHKVNSYDNDITVALVEAC